MANDWSLLADKYASKYEIKIAEIDCTAHSIVCQKYEVLFIFISSLNSILSPSLSLPPFLYNIYYSPIYIDIYPSLIYYLIPLSLIYHPILFHSPPFLFIHYCIYFILPIFYLSRENVLVNNK